MNKPIETIGGRWYWVTFGIGVDCVQAKADNSGFYVGGGNVPWNEAIVIEEAIPPSPGKIHLAIAKDNEAQLLAKGKA